MGARYYQPAIGRFLSVDPLMDPFDPDQIHGYAYANNNPLTYSDPTGLAPWDWIADSAPAVGSTVMSGLGTVKDVGVETWERTATLGVYTWDTSVRRISRPLQTLKDGVTGTTITGDLAAYDAIIREGGRLKRDGEYCGSEMTCIVDVSAGRAAITLGDTVRFRDGGPERCVDSA